MAELNRTRNIVLATLAVGALFLGAPRAARAEEVTPTGKGIVGGAFLGGEVVVFTEAILGVRSGAAYLLGAGAGAAAGGVGGYFVEQAVSDGRIPAYLLAGGLALMIPALVIALDQTRYLPTEGAREDRPVTSSPPSDPGQPGGSAVIGAEPKPATPGPPATPPSGTTPTTPPGGAGGGGTPSPARGPQSLINFQGTGPAARVSVGVPVPDLRPIFTASQKKALGVESASRGGAGSSVGELEVRFPVVHVTF